MTVSRQAREYSVGKIAKPTSRKAAYYHLHLAGKTKFAVSMTLHVKYVGCMQWFPTSSTHQHPDASAAALNCVTAMPYSAGMVHCWSGWECRFCARWRDHGELSPPHLNPAGSSLTFSHLFCWSLEAQACRCMWLCYMHSYASAWPAGLCT